MKAVNGINMTEGLDFLPLPALTTTILPLAKVEEPVNVRRLFKRAPTPAVSKVSTKHSTIRARRKEKTANAISESQNALKVSNSIKGKKTTAVNVPVTAESSLSHKQSTRKGPQKENLDLNGLATKYSKAGEEGRGSKADQKNHKGKFKKNGEREYNVDIGEK